MTSHLIVGAGEVGLALHRAMGLADVRDLEPRPDLASRYDVLHICYRWWEGFVEATRLYQEDYSASLVVVHSSVPVGTCDPEGWVHSPVRGRHPNLLGGITGFVKHFGGARAAEAAEIAPLWGGEARLHERAAVTEAGKLWELTLFGWEVLMQKAVHEFCVEQGLPFEEVYTEFSQTYNEGWAKLGYQEFTKPVLAQIVGPIGGHCVVAGAEMLGTDLAQELVSRNKGLE